MARLKNTIVRSMFYGASPIIFERAKAMRLNPTRAEEKLWTILKNKQILGLRFKFQHPIYKFIADFYCHKLKIVIEVDGGIHSKFENIERDESRTHEMEKFGIEVMRFQNEDILHDIESVRVKIEAKCRQLIEKIEPLHPPAS